MPPSESRAHKSIPISMESVTKWKQGVPIGQLEVGTDYYIELINRPGLSPTYSKKAIGRKFKELISFEDIKSDKYPETYPNTQTLDSLDYKGSMLATFESVDPIPKQPGECYPCTEVFFGVYDPSRQEEGGYKFYDTSIYDEKTHRESVKAIVSQVAKKFPEDPGIYIEGITQYMGAGVRKSRRQTRKRQTRKRQTRKSLD